MHFILYPLEKNWLRKCSFKWRKRTCSFIRCQLGLEKIPQFIQKFMNCIFKSISQQVRIYNTYTTIQSKIIWPSINRLRKALEYLEDSPLELPPNDWKLVCNAYDILSNFHFRMQGLQSEKVGREFLYGTWFNKAGQEEEL